MIQGLLASYTQLYKGVNKMCYIITRGESKKQVLGGSSSVSSGEITGGYWSEDVGRAYKFSSPKVAEHFILSTRFSHHVYGMRGKDCIYIERVTLCRVSSVVVSEIKKIYEGEKVKREALLDKKKCLKEELTKVELELSKILS